jgi:hypothetical protein
VGWGKAAYLTVEYTAYLTLHKRVIKCVWRSKKLEKARADATSKANTRKEDKNTKDDAIDSSDDAVSGEVSDIANVNNDYPLCLRPKY